MSSNPASNRNNDRFAARNPSAISAVLMVLRDDDVITYPCQLADISQGGCAVKANLAQDSDIKIAVLRVTGRDGEIELEVAGRLCWNQQTSVGTNTFGFRFRRPIDNAVIDQMVDRGVVTRRQDDRIISGMPVKLRRAHGKTPVEVAILEDFSTTGVRIRIDQMLETQERILITTEAGASGSLSVVWVTRSEDAFECGCVFQTLSAARAINDSLASLARCGK